MIEQVAARIEHGPDVGNVQVSIVAADRSANSGVTVVRYGYSYIYYSEEESYLTAEDYPILAQIWDNEDDAIFDNL
ncbi:MAG TPA: hypothetical protein VJ256_04965 [Dehalococcoidia bacterium]|nr:hypothetical protein [Dehalococcoidia bacterium]HLB12744.1 hypothetical protein [Dehalococcoidia bacterium]